MKLPFTFTLLLVPALPLAMMGQAPRLPPPPREGPAPLLYVRFGGPLPAHVVFYPTGPRGRDFGMPFTAGFRPGYIYHVQVAGLPDHPGVSLYPTLEVRGTLHLPSGLRAANYPAPLVFTAEDIEHVLAGAFVTKVVFLEKPEEAIPAPGPPSQPLEIRVRASDDPLAEARARGRPMLIVRLGQRQATPEELARQTIPGTILLPGETSLTPPAARPYLPAECWSPFDPLLGPRCPEEECLHDGGDIGTPVGLDRDGHLQGLEPSDTAAVYADSRGRRHVTISNRVCLCVPRFAVIRAETGLVRFDSVVGPGGTQGVQAQNQLHARVPSLQTLQNEQLEGMRGRARPSGAIGTEGVARQERVVFLRAYEVPIGPESAIGTTAVLRLTRDERIRLTRQMELARDLGQPVALRGVAQSQAGPAVVGRVEGVNVIATLQGVQDLTVACDQAPTVLEGPDQPLHLHKWASVAAAKVGDVITFSLKYANHGGKPIRDVAVSDSLTGRLEYIPGSAQSTRDAVFTMQENEAGSLTLHWEITGELPPGGSGVVRFQARVR